MARVKKPEPTLEALCFATPEQKVLRLILTQSTTTFTLRTISSHLKGIRGLGGAEGITRILNELDQLGFLEWLDNQRSVRLNNDHPNIRRLKTLSAICDLEGLQKQLEPISSRGILYGSRASGESRSDSDYDLFVVSDTPEEVKKTAARHPLGKALEVVAWTPEAFESIEKDDPGFAKMISVGVQMWGTAW